MTRGDRSRLEDVLSSAAAIAHHLERGSLDDGLIFDAVRIRLLEIGEAVKAISPDLLVYEPSIPERQATGLRVILAHRYFDTTHGVIDETAHHEPALLVAAVRRLLASID